MSRLAFLFFAASVGVVAVGIGATGVGCGNSSVPDYPLLIDMCDGSICPPSPAVTSGVTATSSSSASGAGGASASSSSTSGSGGATTTSDLTGQVDRITATSFTGAGTLFTGAATIKVYPAAGVETQTPYGADAGPMFTVSGLASGNAWVLVDTPSVASSGVWSTVSSLSLPQIASVTLPVLDQTLIQTIAASLPSVSAKGVSTTSSHVVLMVQQAGAPYAGISVTGDTGGAIAAYDTGSGTYSDTATSTGAAGTVVLFDSSLSGMVTLTLTDTSTSATHSVPILAGPGVFTVLTVEL